jgi:hypothetical protein
MTKTIALAAGAVALLAPLGAVAPTAAAAATTGAPEVAWAANNVRVAGDSAFVTAKYRCAPETEMTHLWVSVKQGGADLEGEGSGGRAQSWYDTNVTTGGEYEIPVTCDGSWQHQTVEVRRYDGKGLLERGPAYVQFCLYTLTGEEFLSATDNSWAKVKTA